MLDPFSFHSHAETPIFFIESTQNGKPIQYWSTRDSLLLFVKHFEPKLATLQYVGSTVVNKNTSLQGIERTLKDMIGSCPSSDTRLLCCQEIVETVRLPDSVHLPTLHPHPLRLILNHEKSSNYDPEINCSCCLSLIAHRSKFYRCETCPQFHVCIDPCAPPHLQSMHRSSSSKPLISFKDIVNDKSLLSCGLISTSATIIVKTQSLTSPADPFCEELMHYSRSHCKLLPSIDAPHPSPSDPIFGSNCDPQKLAKSRLSCEASCSGSKTTPEPELGTLNSVQ